VTRPEDDGPAESNALEGPTSTSAAAPHREGVVPPEQLPLKMPGAISARRSEHYVGPIPSPQMLADYDRVIPGLAEQLVQSFLWEGEHRRECERLDQEQTREYLKADLQLQRRGMSLAFACVLVFAGVACLEIVVGNPWAGAAILGADLATLATVFVYARRAQTRERLAEKTIQQDKQLES
jgi:uncharacterized membrane protein